MDQNIKIIKHSKYDFYPNLITCILDYSKATIDFIYYQIIPILLINLYYTVYTSTGFSFIFPLMGLLQWSNENK